MDAQKLEKQHHIQTYKRYPITLVEGKGAEVTDTNGKTYLDFLAGIAVASLGHSHPAIVKTIRDQADRLMHVSNLFYTEPQSKLAELLTGISNLDRVFFANSGTEAIEAALKLAKKFGYKKGKTGKILSVDTAFHGRSIGAIAMSQPKYQEGFGPMPEGFEIIPKNDKNILRDKINKDTIALFLEPIQGEGGVHVLDKDYLEEARRLCDENDVLLVFDEIQCGMGRLGTMFAYEHFDVKPDIITLAKGMGAGFPIGAMLAKEEVAEAFDFGNHGTTFGGNALAASVAYTTVKTIQDEHLYENAGIVGEYMMGELKDKLKGLSVVKDIRGVGLMIGIELEESCAEVVKTMLDKGIIVNCAAGKVVRIVPPLIVTKEQADKVVKVLKETLEEKFNG